MSRTKTLTVKPIGGLGNRMRALDSAYQLAMEHGFTLQVIWELNRFLNASFSSLFLPVDGVQVRETVNKGLYPIRFPEKSPVARSGTRWLANLLAPQADWCFYQDDFGAWGDAFRGANPNIHMVDFDDLMIRQFQAIWPTVAQSNTIYLSSAYRFFPSKVPFSIFRLPADLQLEVDQFVANWDQVIGVHIRRTDHKKAIRHSLDDWFIQQMDQQLVQQPNVQFFLSTDDPTVIQTFQNRYGDRLIQRASSFDRKDPRAIREALIDLSLLARTQRILGSYFSSFSLTASQIGGVELLIA